MCCDRELILLHGYFRDSAPSKNTTAPHDEPCDTPKLDSFQGFDSFETPLKTICEIETMHIIKKGQVEEIQSTLSDVVFLIKLWVGCLIF